MRGGQIVQGQSVSVDPQSQKTAIKMLNFLSGALQLMPIELCAELTPKILQFSEIEDPQVKINAYLTLEVLFASRRFSNYNVDSGINLVATRTLKHLLDYNEILQNVSYQDVQVDKEGNEIASTLKVDKKDENRIIAYI